MEATMNRCGKPVRVVLLAAVLGALVMLNGRTIRAADLSAPDSFGQPVASNELGTQRGGENDTIDSFNTTTTLDSQQSLTAVNSGNSITAGGDVTSGSVTIASDAMSNLNGMTNVVINSAPQSNVQGGMTLNLILQQAPQP
jgi:hypothetical protein